MESELPLMRSMAGGRRMKTTPNENSRGFAKAVPLALAFSILGFACVQMSSSSSSSSTTQQQQSKYDQKSKTLASLNKVDPAFSIVIPEGEDLNSYIPPNLMKVVSSGEVSSEVLDIIHGDIADKRDIYFPSQQVIESPVYDSKVDELIVPTAGKKKIAKLEEGTDDNNEDISAISPIDPVTATDENPAPKVGKNKAAKQLDEWADNIDVQDQPENAAEQQILSKAEQQVAIEEEDMKAAEEEARLQRYEEIIAAQRQRDTAVVPNSPQVSEQEEIGGHKAAMQAMRTAAANAINEIESEGGSTDLAEDEGNTSNDDRVDSSTSKLRKSERIQQGIEPEMSYKEKVLAGIRSDDKGLLSHLDATTNAAPVTTRSSDEGSSNPKVVSLPVPFSTRPLSPSPREEIPFQFGSVMSTMSAVTSNPDASNMLALASMPDAPVPNTAVAYKNNRNAL